MKSLVGPAQYNILARSAALVLLVATLIIPQLAWADHQSDYTTMDAAFLAMNPELLSYRSFVVASRQDMAAAADSARWAALSASYSADKGTAFLAMNPELLSYRSFVVASRQDMAAAENSARWAALGASYSRASEASSARWAALGASYSADKGADFLASNPEISLVRRFNGNHTCSEFGPVC